MKFKNGTEKFLMKRSIPLYIVAFILSIFFFEFDIQIFVGLTIGYVASLIRLKSLSYMTGMMASSDRGSVLFAFVNYTLVQILTAVFLIVSAFRSIQLLLIASIGVSIITITIMLNAIFEALKLTSNNFE